MGFPKGTNLPPKAIPYVLDNPGAEPGSWPLKNWQKPGSDDHCTPTNPMALTEEHVVGGELYFFWAPTGGTKIKTKIPLSYLYKPETEGLKSDGGGGLMNRFTLPNAECLGANKVLVFATGAAVAPGDMPSGELDCTEVFGNRTYTEFDSVNEQYLFAEPKSYAEMGFDTGAPGGYTDDYTVSAWIKPKALTTFESVPMNYPWQFLVSVSSASLDLWDTEHYGPWNTYLSSSGGPGVHFNAIIKANLGPDGFAPENRHKAYSTQATLTLHQWYHTAFTWHSASQTLTLYIDGISQSVDKEFDEDIPTIWPKKGGSIYISRWPVRLLEWPNKGLSGSIDEVSMWNTNLNDAEVFEIFSSSQYCSDGPGNLNMHSKKDNLISWWRMGETPAVGGVKDIAEGFSAAKWYNCLEAVFGNPAKCVGNDLNIPEAPNNPSFQSEDFLSGALVDVGINVGNPPWIAVSGAFANSNENIVMLPGSRVELTWQQTITKGDPDAPAYWVANVMHSGCYSCSTFGPKVYLTGAIADAALAWPPP